MKPNKALRRLTKIEELMSDMVERFSTNAPSIPKSGSGIALAAVAVAKEAVGLLATSGMATNLSVQHPALNEAKAAESARRRSPLQKAATKKAAPAKAGKKGGPVKMAVVRKPATASARANLEAVRQ